MKINQIVGEQKTMSRAAKGHEKYGKKGMQALAKAGREGAGEKKLDAIRDKHDKYDEGVAGPKKCWPGYKKTGTQPGTGKNKGKRVNDCEKIEEFDMTNSSAKVINNDGKMITFAMPDGTQIQKPITPNTLSADKTGKPVVNMMPATGTPQTMGTAQAPQSPEEIFAKGKDIAINTGDPIEEIGQEEMASMTPRANTPTRSAQASDRKFKEALNAMLSIAGLR